MQIGISGELEQSKRTIRGAGLSLDHKNYLIDCSKNWYGGVEINRL